MSFPRYAAYKDSGIEWLGEIPSHWDVTNVKNIAQLVNGYPFDSKKFSTDLGFPLVRIRDLNNYFTDTLYNGDFIESAAITKADILIGMDGDFNVGRWLGNGFALLNQRMCCIRGQNSELTRLLEYYLPTPLKYINDLTYATTVKHLSSLDVQKIKVSIPSNFKELESILNFLDHETAKIDTLIQQQKKLIELLKEKRQAVISHAVTKGLNPNAPMKDSGVEWLGDVPEHWVIKRLKHISPKVGVGLVINPSTYTRDEGVYFIFGGDVKEYGFDLKKTRRISKRDSDNLLPSKLYHRDLVSVRVGYPGITAVVTEELDGANCASIIVIRKGKFNSDWLCAAMNIWIGRQQVDLASYGAAQKQFNVADAIEFVFPVPPIDEQNQIADFIDKSRSNFEELASKVLLQINLLQERRTALISAAVTGKIDVRNWKPN